MDKILRGIAHFQKTVVPERRELFERLAGGQSPRALFLTCADSRIDPSLITQTDPGELFICRNAGNIVPPHTGATGGMTASIEYAVAELKIPHIIICGHTGCGAMTGALNLDALGHLRHVREWLTFSEAAVQIVTENHPELQGEAKLNAVIEQNIVQQMQHVMTHPYVAARAASGHLSVHGWMYDIKTGGVTAYHAASRRFVPIDAAEVPLTPARAAEVS